MDYAARARENVERYADERRANGVEMYRDEWGERFRMRAFAKTCDDGKSEGDRLLRWGYSSCRGHRRSMEDEVCCKTALPGLGDASGLFGVFDGHGGPQVSGSASHMLVARLIATLRSEVASTKKRKSAMLSQWPPVLDQRNFLNDKIGHILPAVFCDVDRILGNDSQYGGIDADFCGTTSSAACITSDHIVFANLGDSRALLSSGGRVVFATNDHKPEDPIEKDRICNAGGYVLRGRVNGCLAVARAFGDFQFKDRNLAQSVQMVSPVPDITFVDRNHDHDEFVLICCDGIYDVMTSEEAATFVRDAFEDEDVCPSLPSFVLVQLYSRSLSISSEVGTTFTHIGATLISPQDDNVNISDIASKLIDHALDRGSTDNLSVVVVKFEDTKQLYGSSRASARRRESGVGTTSGGDRTSTVLPFIGLYPRHKNRRFSHPRPPVKLPPI